MKKSIASVILLSFSSLCSSQQLEEHPFLLKQDMILNGVLAESNSQSKFLVSKQADILIGKSESGDNLLSGHYIVAQESGNGVFNRIQFTVSESNFLTYYVGISENNGSYVGTWYGHDGRKGDFELTEYIPGSETGIVFVPQQMTSSSIYDGNYGPEKAIDGVFGNNTANVWFSSRTDQAPWLTADFGQNGMILKSYKMAKGYCFSDNWIPTTWKVLASQDGTNWDLLSTVTENQKDNLTCDSFSAPFSVNNSTKYRYYKLSFDNPQVSIAEIEYSE
ncbi:discoidin domain-containing protein [Pseudoalteromonas xiamenensis]|uniref:discoidin domain-containing protein n=1 Tax=Pseudoalteromonas xiamenensis TaxID=882626 RepID=UPI0027E48373|nr:discoidin domain-containing protein [Pseudoalteromonas xiamenensis]WMN61010.1 discoidin domain-containing protein [Pseudoalteromonas xiamenensis]